MSSMEFFQLGKQEPKRDERNLRFGDFIRPAAAPPVEYDFDVKHSGIPLPMFANDEHGDCVIAGRAHQTLRFELVEQDQLLTISDQDVLREYYAETGGGDTGLVMLDSLKSWKNAGWTVADQLYNTEAFGEIRGKQVRRQVKVAVSSDLGVQAGLWLPRSAARQLDAGKPWDVVKGPAGRPGSWGGHCVYIPGYTKRGPVCVTWGRKQQMTWAFYLKYCDEAYVTFDAKNPTNKQKKNLLLAAFTEAAEEV